MLDQTGSGAPVERALRDVMTRVRTPKPTGMRKRLVTAATPQNYVASSGSIQNAGSFLGGTCSPIATGLIVDRTGSFTLALLVAAAIAILGALVYRVLGAETAVTQPTLVVNNTEAA